jgi:surface antigen
MPRGLYRIRNGWVTQHSVRVEYDNEGEREIPETEYRSRGYAPAFDELPWQVEDEGDVA